MYPKSAAWMPQISETYFTCHTERMGVAPLAHCVPLRVPCRTPWLWPAHQRVAGNKKLSAGAQRSGPSVCAGIVFFNPFVLALSTVGQSEWASISHVVPLGHGL